MGYVIYSDTSHKYLSFKPFSTNCKPTLVGSISEGAELYEKKRHALRDLDNVWLSHTREMKDARIREFEVRLK